MNGPNNNRLAINGGAKTILEEFKPYNPIGEQEIRAVNEVLRSGVLSSTLSWHPDFYGGKKFKNLSQNVQIILTFGMLSQLIHGVQD